MKPVIAIVGRPNVGKSTLFNALTRARNALVADFPGVTRDRLYGEAEVGKHTTLLVDTGGIFENTGTEFYEDVLAQARLAIEDANVILFVVDARAGCNVADFEIAKELRSSSKPVLLIANKMDGLDPNIAASDFFSLGLGKIYPVSAAHRQGISSLSDHIETLLDEQLATLVEDENLAYPEEKKPIKIAIAGRPNVGKSTLVNRLLGEARVIVADQAGTTRDSIYIPFTHLQKQYVLIDTAGVRRRSRVHESIEKFSVIKSLQAIEDCDVVIFLMNAQEGVVEQDLHLLDFIMEAGKGIVVAINKWDGLDENIKQRMRDELDRRVPFLDFARRLFISALHGSNVGHLLEAVHEAYASAGRKFTTNEVTNTLRRLFAAHQPPSVQGRPIKLRYAHVGGHYPPVFIIHGHRTEYLPESYKRYLTNAFYDAFKIKGTPIKLIFKSSDNPYVEDGEKE